MVCLVEIFYLVFRNFKYDKYKQTQVELTNIPFLNYTVPAIFMER